ncbi:hypothetical protein WICPIJ_003198 [Wickerhamomyces pijperi]|uniref:AB hydrolase-1 domain-containing protein n=1 Tax=Wickerhamomyces pijperi TaxID=599730 RepID=A0A9P8QAE8_WICPI|nr:hypothetical protein WICPIJ_003198 [Wickerhamomyces pijperi]
MSAQIESQILKSASSNHRGVQTVDGGSLHLKASGLCGFIASFTVKFRPARLLAGSLKSQLKDLQLTFNLINDFLKLNLIRLSQRQILNHNNTIRHTLRIGFNCTNMSIFFTPQKAPARLTQSTHLISGIPVTLHYNSVLSNPIDASLVNDSRKLKILILLHGLSQDEERMSKVLAETVLYGYYPLAVDFACDFDDAESTVSSSGNSPEVKTEVEPLAIVTFDHRNHGKRTFDKTHNRDWAHGNDTHALDLFGFIDGAVADLKLIREFLPLHFPILDQFKVDWLISGVSMGAHTVIRFATQYPDLCDGVIPIVGGFDLTSLLVNRMNGKGVEGTSGLCYEEVVELGLDQAKFPKALFDKISKDDGKVHHDYDTKTGKVRTLALFGEDDEVVISKFSERFLRKHGIKMVQRESAERGAHFTAVTYPGIKHQVSEEMVEDLTRWIVEF